MIHEMENKISFPENYINLANAFMASKAFLTALELDLFTLLDEWKELEDIARNTGCSERGIELLLNALSSLGILKRKGNSFRNTPDASLFLSDNSSNSWRKALLHRAHLWESWSELLESVKKGSTLRDLNEERGDERREIFIEAMHKNGSVRANELVEKFDGNINEGLMLDLGGGSGAYTIAFLKKYTKLRGIIFDTPYIIPLTKKYIKRAGLIERVSFLEGNMLEDSLGEGYNIVLLSSVSHIYGPETNKDIFKKIKKALNKDGYFIIHDFLLNEDKSGPLTSAIFALNMLVNTEEGKVYTFSEYRRWLEEAGFSGAEFLRLEGATDAIVARV